MARIAKLGLEYFPFDIDFFQDIRIRKLIKRQGGKAVTVYALLLCLIYKNGYYMQWDDELPFIGSEISGFEEAYVSEVIKTCLSLGLFHKDLFVSEKILTSKGIQVRYYSVQRLNKRMARIDKYSLLDDSLRHSSDNNKNTDSLSPEKAKLSVSPSEETPVSPVPPKPPVVAIESNANMLATFFADNNRENLMLLCKNFGLGVDGIDCLRSLAQSVVTEWELSKTEHRDYSDWSRHLISCMRIKHRTSLQSSDKTKSNTQSAPLPSDYSFNGGFGGMDI